MSVSSYIPWLFSRATSAPEQAVDEAELQKLALLVVVAQVVVVEAGDRLHARQELTAARAGVRRPEGR